MPIYCQYLLISLLGYLPIAHSAESELKAQTIASGLGVPWSIALMADNSMLITQREGVLSQLNLTTGELTNIDGLPSIKTGGQGGLFDIKLSPNYPDDDWIYFSYNKAVDGKGTTTLARAKLDGKKLIKWQDIFVANARSGKPVHYGGRIAFDNQDHVFLSIGDRGVRKSAQDLLNHAGTIVRLNNDGSVPTDNPFVDNKRALNEVWSYGHRNPQGMFFDTDSKELWSVEHGPRGGDEINLITAGDNYGWPIISYGMEYWGPFAVGEGTEREGMMQPIKTYVPSIAPSSLIRYKGHSFPGWHGTLLVGALTSHINQVILSKDNKAIDERRLLSTINGRIRDIVESPKGWLYVSTDDGRILKITDTSSNNGAKQQ